MTQEEANKMLDRTLSQLSEHFDCVQIVASTLEPDGSTRPYVRGTGNWFARRALCQYFIERDQADTQASILGPVINPPDEGDAWKEKPPEE